MNDKNFSCIEELFDEMKKIGWRAEDSLDVIADDGESIAIKGYFLLNESSGDGFELFIDYTRDQLISIDSPNNEKEYSFKEFVSNIMNNFEILKNNNFRFDFFGWKNQEGKLVLINDKEKQVGCDGVIYDYVNPSDYIKHTYYYADDYDIAYNNICLLPYKIPETYTDRVFLTVPKFTRIPMETFCFCKKPFEYKNNMTFYEIFKKSYHISHEDEFIAIDFLNENEDIDDAFKKLCYSVDKTYCEIDIDGCHIYGHSDFGILDPNRNKKLINIDVANFKIQGFKDKNFEIAEGEYQSNKTNFKKDLINFLTYVNENISSRGSIKFNADSEGNLIFTTEREKTINTTNLMLDVYDFVKDKKDKSEFLNTAFFYNKQKFQILDIEKAKGKAQADAIIQNCDTQEIFVEKNFAGSNPFKLKLNQKIDNMLDYSRKSSSHME